jgi:methionyl-tRNA formyltransferase
MSRIFLFANRGHGSAIINDMLASRLDILMGVCSRPPRRASLRRWLGRVRSDFRDTFEADRHPFQFSGKHRRFPSRDLEAVERFLWADRPDVVLCCGFHRRLPIGILRAPTFAAINIHAGLLPSRGGGTPTRWAIRDGDPEIRVTAHLMTEDFDAGSIVWQQRIPLPPDIAQGGAEALLRPLILRAFFYVSAVASEERTFDTKLQTPSVQPSYRGELFPGLPEPRACRAMLPKACPYGFSDCRRRSARPCKITV